ncbi:D-alanine--D-alanine ligase [Actinorhabdospora filicis]|uniref:D-alanine--D-alanine ligase n=1 Tax=Actinorhabdospora filicis TaxID=1785913 RepID=A0A9W6WBB9_9ACTN|nr:D-alanine--D-alanine ligase family protein [Actinorhabdospora filicis]GLZ79913.1 D-alanine--D-alanine ligase [Actinorhabdospora filicis]
MTDRKIRVAVIFGGRSGEHPISCVSAGNVFEALDPGEFEVVPIGITREGRWVLADGDPTRLAIAGRVLPEVTDATGEAVALAADPTVPALRAGDGLSGVDVVFPILHGAYGEDGTVQGLLELAGIPYVGAGVLSSAVSLDKEFTKRLLAAEGVPVVPYAVLRPGMELSEGDKERLGLPVFVKPARGGSSLGITKVTDWAGLDAALAAAREVDPKVLVETAVPGVREVECGVLEGEDGGPPEASVPAEIRVVAAEHDWYDFEAKYLDDASEFDLPPNLPAEVVERVRELSLKAFTALDGAGLARVDFFVTADLEIYFNEINTMPGFTSRSMFPMMWAASGLDYPKLVTRMVRTALARGTGLR